MKRQLVLMTISIVAAANLWAQEIGQGASATSSEDAVAAASHSHDVLFENGNVRLVSVTILPGESAPMHSHELPSVLIIDSYATATEELASGFRIMSEYLPTGTQVPFVLVREAQSAHAIANTDTEPLHLYRLEFKRLEFQNVRRATEQRRNQTQ